MLLHAKGMHPLHIQLVRVLRHALIPVVTILALRIGFVLGGAITVEHFQLHHWAFSTVGLCALGGLMFACGLPGWAMVRWVFNFIGQRRDASIDQVAKDVKEML